MADPLVAAIGAQAQQVLREHNVDINAVGFDSDEEYVIEVPDEDLSTEGIRIIVKGQ